MEFKILRPKTVPFTVNTNKRAYFLLYNMPFKKGTSGNPIGRPKGSVSATTKLKREHLSQAIDGNKIME